MNRKYVWIGIAVLIFSMLLAGNAYALEETFQYDGLDNWNIAESPTIITKETYIKVVFFGPGVEIDAIKNKYPSESDYWSFVMMPYDWNDPGPRIYLYNSSGGVIHGGEYYQGAHVQCTVPGGSSMWSFIELVRIANKLYVFRNGEVVDDTPPWCNETIAYINISLCFFNFYINDISNEDGYVVGFGEFGYDNTALECDDTKIAVSYTTNQYYDSGSDFGFKVKRLVTGEIKNATDLSNPLGYLIYNRTEVLGYDYGLYLFYVTKDGQMMDFDWLFYAPLGETSTVNIEHDTYPIGNTVRVDYSIGDYASGDNYYLKIYDAYGTEKKSWSLSTETGYKPISSYGWNAGTYYAILYHNNDELAVDAMSLTYEVQIEGITYDAEAETALASVNVSYRQGAVYYNTTSNATGHYNLSGLIVDAETFTNATKTNYTHNDFSFTPLTPGTYIVDLYLLLNETYISYTNTSIGGLVTHCPLHQAIEGATVNLWNTSSSWNESDTTNSKGYYLFDDIPNGTTYKINATNEHCDTEEDDITTNDGGYRYHYFCLDCWYNLTVTAKDASTHTTITTFTAVLDDTTTSSTTTSTLNFTGVYYGIHKLEVSAEGYYTSLEYVYVPGDTETIMHLTPLEEAEGGAGVYYPPPHLVEFRVVDIWGVPLSNIAVNATGYETTVINLTWWQTLFGFSSEIEVYNSTATGTTDSAGHISFFMVETIKYKMYFTNASQNVSAYREIYPKDERYTVTIGEIPEQKLAYWITTEQNDSASTGNITLHYSDYNSPVKTNWVNFSIYYLNNDTLAYTHNFTTINETNENTSIDLNATYSYKVKCTVSHDDFGEFAWYVMVVYILPEKPKLPVVQTLKDSLEDWQLQTFSMFVIILFALIFGAYSSGVGGMVVSFMAIGFHLFGMMPLVPVLAGVVIYPLIAVMAIVNLLGEQKGSAEV